MDVLETLLLDDPDDAKENIKKIIDSLELQ